MNKRLRKKMIKYMLCYLLRFIPDEYYIKIIYWLKNGEKLDLIHPHTYNEKIQHKKIYDRNPIYEVLVDKYRVREYVKCKIGEEYLIPLLGVWNDETEITLEELPRSFVLKCNHDSGTVIICEDKNVFNYDAAKQELGICRKMNYYYRSREYAYKNVKPCILAEQLIKDDDGPLKDYKIFCFHGKAKYVQVDFDRQTHHTRRLYDTEWNPLNVRIEYPISSVEADRPQQLKKMIEIAEKLSENLSDARIDLYSVTTNGINKVYFGEITLYHGSGLEKIVPESFGYEMGVLI